MDIEKQEAGAKKATATAKVVYLRGALKAVERTIREAEQQRREIVGLLESAEEEAGATGAP